MSYRGVRLPCTAPQTTPRHKNNKNCNRNWKRSPFTFKVKVELCHFNQNEAKSMLAQGVIGYCLPTSWCLLSKLVATSLLAIKALLTQSTIYLFATNSVLWLPGNTHFSLATHSCQAVTNHSLGMCDRGLRNLRRSTSALIQKSSPHCSSQYFSLRRF